MPARFCSSCSGIWRSTVSGTSIRSASPGKPLASSAACTSVGERAVAQLPRADVDDHAERLDARVEPAPPLRAGFAQHPGADRHQEPAVVGERQEGFGGEHAVARMAPAQQRFGADHLARGDVDARLVDEEQLVALDARAQLLGERRRGRRVLVQHHGEELVAVAPGSLARYMAASASRSSVATSSPSCGTQAMPMLAPERSEVLADAGRPCPARGSASAPPRRPRAARRCPAAARRTRRRRCAR